MELNEVLGVPASWALPVVLIFGALIGSFLNVVIHRLPAGESIVWPGSRCPRCRTQLAWYDNLPVLSWILLRGRCRSCQAPISPRYPTVELANAVLFGALFQRFGATPQFLAVAVLSAVLVAIFWIDLDTMLIHDVLTMPMMALGALYAGLVTHQLVQGLASAGAAILVLEAVDRLVCWWKNRSLGGEEVADETWGGVVARVWTRPAPVEAALGGGDVMLAALLGLWFGWQALLVAFFIACVLGGAVGIYLLRRDGESRHYPFGPYIVVGAFVAIFAGDPLWHWYLHLVVG